LGVPQQELQIFSCPTPHKLDEPAITEFREVHFFCWRSFLDGNLSLSGTLAHFPGVGNPTTTQQRLVSFILPAQIKHDTASGTFGMYL
jgi:hypothetical protein